MPKFQIVRRLGKPAAQGAWHSRLYHGDNAVVMVALLREFGGKLDLIAIDPPFNTGRAQGRKETAAYDDAWGGGWDGYLAMLGPRVAMMRELLAPSGVLIVHVDYRAHPHVRLLLDRLFGEHLLVNDIVWSYRSGGGSKRRFGFKHDNLLVYARTRDWYFDASAARVPYDAVIAEKRRSLFHADGKVGGDVWDISRPPNHSKEWVGYPTQKPEALLERQILVFSPPGGLVADFFCGSGTMGIVAERHGRRWIMADASEAAVEAACKRLEAARETAALPGVCVYSAVDSGDK